MDDLWAMKSEDVGLIVCAISFQDVQPMWLWFTNITDGQTDNMWSQDHALHYSTLYGKNRIELSWISDFSWKTDQNWSIIKKL